MLEEEDASAAPSVFLFASLLSTTQAPYPVFFFVIVIVSVVIVQIDRYCLFFVMSVIDDDVVFLQAHQQDTIFLYGEFLYSLKYKNPKMRIHARHKCDLRDISHFQSHILILFTVINRSRHV